MTLKDIDDTFSVSPQIAAADLPALKEQGFTMLICARPDGEEPGQPSFDDIKEAATQLGITAIHIPIVPGQATQADVQRMDDVLAEADGRVLGYCKGGPRAEALYKATGR